MIRVGMIGCGGMGNYHAPVLAKLPNVKVVATCDMIEEKAHAMGDKIGVRHCVDYHNLLDDVDAVWVCTEPFNRLPIVTTCAQAGKHVFTEKPICLDPDEGQQMVDAARKAGVKYMLGYCLRFWNPYKPIRDIFAAGELGSLVTCWTRRYMPCDMTRLWYGHQPKSGGVMLDFGSHDVDWLRWVGGDVRTVFASASTVRETMHADEHGSAMFLFGSGGMGAIDVSWSSYLGESTFGVVGDKGAIIVARDGKVRKKIGDAAEVLIDTDIAMDIDPSGNLGKKADGGRIEKVALKNESIQEHFFRCIEENIEPVTAAADGLKTLRTVKAMHESAATGKSVDVK